MPVANCAPKSNATKPDVQIATRCGGKRDGHIAVRCDGKPDEHIAAVKDARPKPTVPYNPLVYTRSVDKYNTKDAAYKALGVNSRVKWHAVKVHRHDTDPL